MKTIATIIFKATFLTVVTIACVDFAGFMLWASSGQQPPDDFYVGTLTTHALRWMLPK